MSKNYIPCAECGELEDSNLHHDMPDVIGNTIPPTPHFDECNYEASYEGEERGWVPSMHCVGDPLEPVATYDCHEFEEGCSCGERNRCDWCVDKAVDYADHLRDAAKESA